MNCKVWYMWASMLLLWSTAQAEETSPVDRERLKTALERSVVYLQREGRAWFDGDVPIQHQGCVSCHQVPTGLWSLSAAYHVLQQPPRPEFSALLSDATQFVANAEPGHAAKWSQLLIADRVPGNQTPAGVDHLADTYVPLILDAQQENGSWLSQGQFPSQRRPLAESDAVVTMWMMHALQICHVDSPTIAASMQRARAFVESSSGRSTEWLAWRLLVSDDCQSDAVTLRQQLVTQQHPDGSWGWAKDEPGNAYATGVALYALAFTSHEAEAVQKAAEYLLANQGEDGSWQIDSHLVSKEGSDSRDYVYRYWSTAWATIGLAELLKDNGHAWSRGV